MAHFWGMKGLTVDGLPIKTIKTAPQHSNGSIGLVPNGTNAGSGLTFINTAKE